MYFELLPQVSGVAWRATCCGICPVMVLCLLLWQRWRLIRHQRSYWWGQEAANCSRLVMKMARTWTGDRLLTDIILARWISKTADYTKNIILFHSHILSINQKLYRKWNPRSLCTDVYVCCALLSMLIQVRGLAVHPKDPDQFLTIGDDAVLRLWSIKQRRYVTNILDR